MPHPSKLTFDLLTSKMVSELRVTWATSVVFVDLSVLDLDPMYATARQTDVRQTRETASFLNNVGFKRAVL